MSDNAFFYRHQKLLVWFANTEIGRKFFGVEKMGHKTNGRKIDFILPNSIGFITGRQGDSYVIEQQFFSRDEYARRLQRFAFSLAVPQLAVGLSTITVNPDASPETTTTDGFAEVQARATFAIARSAASGDAADHTHATAGAATGSNMIRCIQTGTTFYISRSFFLFDTSSITASSPVTAATFSIFGQGTSSNIDGDSVAITGCTPASNTAIVLPDYSAITLNSPTEFATRLGFTSWSTAAYNSFSFNATGIAGIATTGVTMLCARSALDLTNTAPTNFNFVDGFYSDNGSNKPTLTVTYLTNGNSQPILRFASNLRPGFFKPGNAH